MYVNSWRKLLVWAVELNSEQCFADSIFMRIERTSDGYCNVFSTVCSSSLPCIMLECVRALRKWSLSTFSILNYCPLRARELMPAPAVVGIKNTGQRYNFQFFFVFLKILFKKENLLILKWRLENCFNSV